MSDTIYQLQAKGALPDNLLKRPPKKGAQQQKKANRGNEEVSWDFDSKEHAREKYGNFNTPILIKLTSKYNK